MKFSFNEEQRLLRESVQKYAAEHFGLAAYRERARDPGKWRDDWRRFADLGWLALPFPEEYGGVGGTPVETMILLEEFGRGLARTPYLESIVLAGQLLLQTANPRQLAALLPELLTGDLLLGAALGERQATLMQPAQMTTIAVPTAGGFRLSGNKAGVAFADDMDKLLVLARHAEIEGALVLGIVAIGSEGLTMQGYPTVDGQRAADVCFEQVELAAEDVLDASDDLAACLDNALDHGLCALCGETTGALGALYALTLTHLKEREQFGHTLGSFQVIQHRMVDVFMACELATSMCYSATLALDVAEPTFRHSETSAAMVQLAESARLVGREAVQLHGGMGMTEEYAVGHYYKRLAVVSRLLGSSDDHLRRFRQASA